MAFTDNEPLRRRPGQAGHQLPAGLYGAGGPAQGGGGYRSRARCRGQDGGVLEPLGPNMVRRPPRPSGGSPAPSLTDADVYYGHSAHVFQGVEVYRGRPILYDTGDFIDDYAVDPDLRNDHSLPVPPLYGGRRARRLELFPVVLPYARVELAAGEEREAILDIMQDLSAEMGTTFERREDRLVLEPA